MLVLLRKIGQTIIIEPTNAVIRLLQVMDCSSVRLGIEAPSHVRIIRDETIPKRDAARRGVMVRFYRQREPSDDERPESMWFGSLSQAESFLDMCEQFGWCATAKLDAAEFVEQVNNRR